MSETSQTFGDKSTCSECSQEIHWSGKYWEHTHATPRHIARPASITPNQVEPSREQVEITQADRVLERNIHLALLAASKSPHLFPEGPQLGKMIAEAMQPERSETATLTQQLTAAQAEIEQVKSERNRQGVLIRSEYLAKTEELRAANARANQLIGAQAEENDKINNTLVERVKGLEKQNKEQLCIAYSMGYNAGHHDTVEGGYFYIVTPDLPTHHIDVIEEMLKDGTLTPTKATDE